jgi:vancomycin permeability regulator SanA
MLRIWFRRVVVAGALAVATAVLTMADGSFWVRSASAGSIHTVADAPSAPVALVLGAEVYPIERAVALCRHLGVDASGIGDDTVRIYTDPWRASARRESGAVVKAMADVVSGRDPIFLGRYETTVDDALRLG